MIKRLTLIVVSAILATAASVHVSAQQLTKIRVANIGGTSDHIQVAINAGIYKKHGFDVENIQVGSSATVVQSLIAGEVNFAHVGAVPVVAAVAKGIDVKIIAVFMNRFNYLMVTLPELQRPQDLRHWRSAALALETSSRPVRRYAGGAWIPTRMCACCRWD
jgi:ABC-type nitrate/sulfonate/bicarbonate transport system substrate-binding protein